MGKVVQAYACLFQAGVPDKSILYAIALKAKADPRAPPARVLNGRQTDRQPDENCPDLSESDMPDAGHRALLLQSTLGMESLSLVPDAGGEGSCLEVCRHSSTTVGAHPLQARHALHCTESE